MPKNADQSKSKMRFKTARKPLRDVSNAKDVNQSALVNKKISDDARGQAPDDSLDRLLLVHSDISSLLRQIDDIVVQALQLTSNNGRKEIKQFADVLSDTQTSLKPWVSRLQKALLSLSAGPENEFKRPKERDAVTVSKENTNTILESPAETKWESLVSPSPLVSWRAGCHPESGRQLFLLTPLPQKKAFSSKYKASHSTLENIPSDEVAHPSSLCDPVGNLGNDLHLPASAKPTPKTALGTELTKAAVDNLQTDCASPEKVSKNTNCHLFVMTPCMKMSPPKSCILLEPVSFSTKKSQVVRKSTPFPTKIHSFTESQDSESSSDESSEGLKLKYPELCGINKENMQKKMVAEDSPNWIVSPPKTCVILDPSSDNCLPLNNTAANKANEKDTSKKELQGIVRTLDLAEMTPNPMSSFRMGKHPGENTLKKELWMRFEAASADGICLNTCFNKKGFLDILDEVSDA